MPAHVSTASSHMHISDIQEPAHSDYLSRVMRSITSTKADLAPLLARLALGAVMFGHGAQKALGWFGGYGWAGTMGFFTSKLGIPAPLAALAIAAEFLGSLGLLFGLLSRVAAFGIASVMLVAILLVHRHVGFFMNWYGGQSGEGIEYHLLALGLAFVVLVKGGGIFSADHWLSRQSSLRMGKPAETAPNQGESR